MNSLGERLYNLRTNRDMSQGDLAEKLNVSRQTVSKWENNMSIPELDKIIALSEVFGVSVDYIVKGQEDIPAPTVSEKIKDADCDSTDEPSHVRMIRVDPTKKIVVGLSVAAGIINIIPLILGVVQRISIFMTSPGLSAQLESWPEFIFSVIIGLLLSIALFSQNEKFVAAVLSLKAVLSLTVFADILSGQFILNFISASAVLGTVAGVLVAVGYITAKKSSAKFYLGSIISIRVIAFILSFANSYINSIKIYNSGALNGILSAISMTKWYWVTLFVNIVIALLVYYKANPKPYYEVPESTYPEHSDMYVGMVKHVLLSIFTFGIYNCIWTYKITENLNAGNNEKQNGTNKLLLCIFVPFYRLYWYYNQSRRLENLMKMTEERSSDFAVVTLILAVFVPIVAASAFLQVKVNEYAGKQ